MSLRTKTKVRTTVEIIIIVIAFIGVAIDLLTQRSLLSAFKLLSFYTIQSNIIVVIVMIVALLKGRKNSEHEKSVSFLVGGATVWILITGIIFYFMLSKIYQPEGLKAIANVMLHYWTPSFMMFYFLIFVNKNVVKMKYPLLWSLYPIIYGLGCLIRGSIDGFYPYWFMKPYGSYPEGIGSYQNVVLVILAMVVGFLIIGYLVLFIKKVVVPFVEMNNYKHL